jgi:hypothetical protein
MKYATSLNPNDGPGAIFAAERLEGPLAVL